MINARERRAAMRPCTPYQIVGTLITEIFEGEGPGVIARPNWGRTEVLSLVVDEQARFP